MESTEYDEEILSSSLGDSPLLERFKSSPLQKKVTFDETESFIQVTTKHETSQSPY